MARNTKSQRQTRRGSVRQPVVVRPLTDAERTQLEAGLRSSDPVVLRQCQILVASARGEQAPQIARRLGYHDQAVRNIIHAFNATGLAGLRPRATEAKQTPVALLTPVSAPMRFAMDPAFIVELCTTLWRVDKGLAQLAHKDASAELQRLVRRFDDLKDVLHRAHIELHDYTGQRYDPGLTVRVLTYQPAAGIAAGREIILETIKPTVYCHAKLIAPGEVVVGVPLPAGESGQEAT